MTDASAAGTRRPAAGSGVDRSVLAVWVASRVGVGVASAAAIWMVIGDRAGNLPSWVASWDRWDVGLFVKVAKFGYLGRPEHYSDRGIVAFFPGEPLLLRAVHAVIGDWIVAGLLISAVAGAVACVALARLGDLEWDASTGSRAALYLVLSPFAVFLAAGYSEALFLALALPAWLAARRGRWWWAGGLTALAGTVRITAVFLAVALVVQWLVDPLGARPDGSSAAARRRPVHVLALLSAFAGTAAYFGYLRAITGDWLAWAHAQRAVWDRSLTAPWTALHATWSGATDPTQGAAYAWSFRAEIVAIAVGVLLCLVLLALRRWAEVVYVGGQVVALGTSSYFLSVARASLLWWPLWLLLARAGVRHRWVHLTYVAVAPALMAVGVVTFVSGHWVG
ncbi:MAG TPA: mannosyltransferase family protein [Mycobacteriales bacterium]|nr:mannosyltransferase family protein [Mycobacteriales bacterium]